MPTRVSEMDTPAHPVNKVVTGAGGKVLGEHYKYVQLSLTKRGSN